MKKRNLIIFAILILCLFFCVEKDVFAESYIASSAPEQFTTNQAGKSVNAAYDAIMSNTAISANATGRGNNVTDYHTSTKEKIFCIDRMTDYAPGAVYRKSSDAVDYGIVYIITHAQDQYNSFASKLPATVTNKDLEMSWFTQIAIWKYLNQNNFTSITSEVQTKGTDIFEEDSSPRITYSQNAFHLWRYADDLVNAAKSQAGTNPSIVNNLAFNYDGTHTVDKENKTIRTGVISIQNSSEVSSFSLDLSKAPSGTKVYNESGSELTSLTDIPSTTRFYLIVPISNPDNYTFDFNISATASYTYYNGYKYTSGANQPVVLVTNDTKSITAALRIEGSHVEDTASSISRVMYISGLFILLCGVGIIYANVKPKKQKN